MTIILTNDDGINAPGIQALQSAVAQSSLGLGSVTVVAPLHHHSGCGHRVTTDRPIAIHPRSSSAIAKTAQAEYAVDGTPADCTRLALTHIAPTTSWVLSGINAGGNLGVDIYLSGTVAAVREAAIHGIPAIAISHWIRRPLEIDWIVASRWAAKVIGLLEQQSLPKGSFWNVNLPHLPPDSPDPEIVFCSASTEPLPVQYRVEENRYHYVGEYALRDRHPGSDVDVCFSGKIAITQLAL